MLRRSLFSLSCSFFFFKQKTAYEMRISDWSSDVCSSDLRHRHLRSRMGRDRGTRHADAALVAVVALCQHRLGDRLCHPLSRLADGQQRDRGRSDEHTYELQSLMRISYAVFCLKKKTQITDINMQHLRLKRIDNIKDTQSC